MAVELVLQVTPSHPDATTPRVHHLDPASHASPQQQEVLAGIRTLHHGDGRQLHRLLPANVVEGSHRLECRETEASRELLQRVDGRAVHLGLTGLTQTT